MKTISDLLEVKPIFQGLIEALPVELEFLGDIDGEILDSLLINYYGDRELTKKAISNPDLVIGLLPIALGRKWKGFGKLWEVDFDLASNGINETTTKIKENEDKNYKVDDVNKVTAFDDGEMIDDTGRVSDSKEDRKTDSERVTSVNNKSIGLALKNLQMADNFNIIGVMLKDVANQISLSIY